jgi:predicted DNA-binding antitoxin AbrB/MazE fold protein
MHQRVRALYKNGIFYPLEPLDLAEGSSVEIRNIESLGDVAEYIKRIENDLAELDANESKHLENELADLKRLLHLSGSKIPEQKDV